MGLWVVNGLKVAFLNLQKKPARSMRSMTENGTLIDLIVLSKTRYLSGIHREFLHTLLAIAAFARLHSELLPFGPLSSSFFD